VVELHRPSTWAAGALTISGGSGGHGEEGAAGRHVDGAVAANVAGAGNTRVWARPELVDWYAEWVCGCCAEARSADLPAISRRSAMYNSEVRRWATRWAFGPHVNYWAALTAGTGALVWHLFY
jgi:hypothetical protein